MMKQPVHPELLRHCPTCQYELTGLAASDVDVKCPECGFWCEAGEGRPERSFGAALLRIISPQIAATLIMCASAFFGVYLVLLLFLPVIAFGASVLIYAIEVKPPAKNPRRKHPIALALLALVDSVITVAIGLLLLMLKSDLWAGV